MDSLHQLLRQGKDNDAASSSSLKWCRCCGERRMNCVLLADAFRPDPYDQRFVHCLHICPMCHTFVGNLMAKILTKSTHDKVLRYWLQKDSISLPKNHIFVEERMKAIMDTTSSDHLRKAQGFVPYVPGLVVEYLSESWGESSSHKNIKEISDTGDAVILMADVTGYTALAETFCEQRGVNAGIEDVVTNCLNKYFTKLVETIYEYGGDVVKFAGDAVLCIWKPQIPSSKRMQNVAFAKQHRQQTLETYAQAAMLCAFRAKSLVERVQVGNDTKVLKLHCGLAAGKVAIISVGGSQPNAKREILVTGETLRRAGEAVEHAAAESVVVCYSVWRLVRTITICTQVEQNPKTAKLSRFFGEDIPTAKTKGSNGFWLVKQITVALELDRPSTSAVISQKLPPVELLLGVLESYIPNHVVKQMKTRQRIHNDVRLVSTLFLNISNEARNVGYETNQEQLELLHDIFSLAQRIVDHHEGMVRQFIVDDKGCVLIVCFGVSTYRHKDDAARAIATAFDLQKSLRAIVMEDDSSRLKTSIGVTTGRAFCGPIGSKRSDELMLESVERREYSVVGNCVNLAARLMNVAYQREEGILCDETTAETVRLSMGQNKSGPTFTKIDSVQVKGIKEKVGLYKPSKASSAPVNSVNSKQQQARQQTKQRVDKSRQSISMDLSSESGGVCFGRNQEKAFISHRLFAFTKGVLDPCILIQGEEGMGKTNLLEWVREEIRTNYIYSSIKVLGGSCQRSGSRISYYGVNDNRNNNSGLRGFFCELFNLPGNDIEEDQEILSSLVEKLQQLMARDGTAGRTHAASIHSTNTEDTDTTEDDKQQRVCSVNFSTGLDLFEESSRRKSLPTTSSSIAISMNQQTSGEPSCDKPDSNLRNYLVQLSEDGPVLLPPNRPGRAFSQETINKSGTSFSSSSQSSDDETQAKLSRALKNKRRRSDHIDLKVQAQPTPAVEGSPLVNATAAPVVRKRRSSVPKSHFGTAVAATTTATTATAPTTNNTTLGRMRASLRRLSIDKKTFQQHRENSATGNGTAIDEVISVTELDLDDDDDASLDDASLEDFDDDNELDDIDDDSSSYVVQLDGDALMDGLGEYELANQRLLNQQTLQFRYTYPLISSKVDETTIRVFLSSSPKDLAQCIIHMLSNKQDSFRDTSKEDDTTHVSSSNKTLSSTDALVAELLCLVLMLSLKEKDQNLDRQICITIDDLEWLDTLSMAMLRNIIGPQCPGVMVIGTVRSSAIDRVQKKLGYKLSTSPFIYPFELSPLNEEEIRELLVHTFEIPSWPQNIVTKVLRSCNGLPLWAIEYVRGLMANKYIKRDEKTGEWMFDQDNKSNMEVVFSAGLEGAILQRFDNLKEEIWKQAFIWACVIESDFTVSVLRELLVYSDIQDKLNELVKLRHVIKKDNDEYLLVENQNELGPDLLQVLSYAKALGSLKFTLRDIVDERLGGLDNMSYYQDIVDELQRERFIVPSFNSNIFQNDLDSNSNSNNHKSVDSDLSGGPEKQQMYRVAHDYYYHAVYNQIPPGELGRYHLQTAQCLSGHDNEFIQPLLAHHYRKANDNVSTVKCLFAAGKSHYNHNQVEQAVAFLKEGVRLGDSLPEQPEMYNEESVSMKLLLGNMLIYLGRHPEAEVYLGEIQDIAGSDLDRAERRIVGEADVPVVERSSTPQKLRRLIRFSSAASLPLHNNTSNGTSASMSSRKKSRPQRHYTTSTLPSFLFSGNSSSSSSSKRSSTPPPKVPTRRASFISSMLEEGPFGKPRSASTPTAFEGIIPSAVSAFDKRPRASSNNATSEPLKPPLHSRSSNNLRRPSLKRMCSGSMFPKFFASRTNTVENDVSFIAGNADWIRANALLLTMSFFQLDHETFIHRLKMLIAGMMTHLNKDSKFIQFLVYIAHCVSPKYTTKIKPSFTLEMVESVISSLVNDGIENIVEQNYLTGMIYQICAVCSISRGFYVIGKGYLDKAYIHMRRSSLLKQNVNRKRLLEIILMNADVSLQRGFLMQAEKLCKEVSENYRGVGNPQVAIWTDAWETIIRFKRNGILLTLKDITSFEEKAVVAQATKQAAAAAAVADLPSSKANSSIGGGGYFSSRADMFPDVLDGEEDDDLNNENDESEQERLMVVDRVLGNALKSWKIGDPNNPGYNENDATHSATIAWNLLVKSNNTSLVWYLGLAYEILFYSIVQLVRFDRQDEEREATEDEETFTLESLKQLLKSFKSFSETFPGYKSVFRRCKGLMYVLLQSKNRARDCFRKSSRVAAKLGQEYEQKLSIFLLEKYCNQTNAEVLLVGCGVPRNFAAAFDFTVQTWRTTSSVSAAELLQIVSSNQDCNSPSPSRRSLTGSGIPSAGFPALDSLDNSFSKLRRRSSSVASRPNSGGKGGSGNRRSLPAKKKKPTAHGTNKVRRRSSEHLMRVRSGNGNGLRRGGHRRNKHSFSDGEQYKDIFVTR